MRRLIWSALFAKVPFKGRHAQMGLKSKRLPFETKNTQKSEDRFYYISSLYSYVVSESVYTDDSNMQNGGVPKSNFKILKPRHLSYFSSDFDHICFKIHSLSRFYMLGKRGPSIKSNYGCQKVNKPLQS